MEILIAIMNIVALLPSVHASRSNGFPMCWATSYSIGGGGAGFGVDAHDALSAVNQA